MEGTLRCPRDGSATELHRVGGRILGFTVDVCPRCGGTWLDRGELRKVMENAKIEDLIRDYGTRPAASLECPRDAKAMKRRKLADVEVDACGSCGGFWIDAGELAGLEAASKTGPKERTGESRAPGLEARDLAILAIVSPDTLQRYQHSQMRK